METRKLGAAKIVAINKAKADLAETHKDEFEALVNHYMQEQGFISRKEVVESVVWEQKVGHTD